MKWSLRVPGGHLEYLIRGDGVGGSGRWGVGRRGWGSVEQNA